MKNNLKTFSIGEIAQRMNVSVDTLRYYDKEGLLPFVKRDQAGRRQFTEDDLGYLEVIDCMKKSAIPVKEIGTFIDFCMTGDQTLADRYEFLNEHEVMLEDKIKTLETQLAFLRWKKWYYKRALDAGTEQVNLLPGTTQVDPQVHQIYDQELRENN